MIIKAKKCSKCGESLPATAEFFNVKKSSKDGLRADCKKCRNKSRRKSYKTNSTHRKNYDKKWRENTPEKQRIYYLRSIGETEESLAEKKKQKRAKKIIKKALAPVKIISPVADVLGWKQCTCCGESKQNSSSNFPKRTDSIDGYGRVCLTCKHTKAKEFRLSGIIGSSSLFNRLSIYEETKKVGKLGFARCAYCGKWVNPTRADVKARVAACEKIGFGENRIYCPGEQCREACPTYKQQMYPKGFKNNSSREVDPLIRQMCMERDNYSCQKCGASGESVTLHAHHILSYTKNKIVGNDIENVITLCKSCHNEIHQTDGCKYHELRCDAA